MRQFNPKDIESKWQKIWDETGVYTTDLNSVKPKYIGMSMFNYPSGAGIHIGHALTYTISDVKARFKRQQGYESYHPVGWDAFGLPAENYAIKSGVSPQESMATIIPGYHKQYKAMGWSNDWEKEISTHLPEYYEWSQWIFAQMYKQGLAYQDSRMQWWCAQDNTVLANEQVIDGKCWRHDGANDPLVEKREVKQWFFKITDYADELLEATDALDWTESVKLAQKNWIGKSAGAEIDFGLDFGDAKVNARKGPDGKPAHITVFTTRPDTMYGVTYLVLAPEHKWIELALEHKNVLKNNDEVKKYVEESTRKSEVERQENKQKTGVKLEGVEAVNPVNGEKISIFVADYVLTGYGTGAIMAVPAHDERDHEFAQKFDLNIKPVVAQDFGQKLEDAKQIEGVAVIGYDPKTKKYMGLRDKKRGWGWIVGGGREEGESFQQTAVRELHEEAGFAEVEKWVQLGDPVYSYYYNDIKQSNRRSFGYNFLAIIDHEKQAQQKQESHENFEVIWRDFDELYTDIEKTGGGVDHWLDTLNRAKRVTDSGSYEYVGCYNGEGSMVNSDKYDGMVSAEAREKIVADLAKKGVAKEKVNFRMRDWSVSRQRYWGAPIPIINCPKCGPQLVLDEDLPVILPELTDFQPSGDGRSALARAKDWLVVDCPKCGHEAERETDTLDTYVDSSFYMYRYFDPHNQERIFDSKIANKWAPIDFYNGADHATAHLLYARFIGHFFKKIGLIDEPEPFKHFVFNGKVTAHDGTMFSKSKGNGVDPLEIIDQGYGADALRTYLMFASPIELWTKWDSQGVPGAYRFLNRLWNLVQEYLESQDDNSSKTSEDILRSSHKMIKKVTEDIENDNYNTAIAAMMQCVNGLYKLKPVAKNNSWKQALDNLVACVAPFAPHTADELWQQLGHSTSVQKDSWPDYDAKYLASDTMKIAVQVNGKLRATIDAPADSSGDKVKDLAQQNDNVSAHLESKQIVKTIYVPSKIVNFVVK